MKISLPKKYQEVSMDEIKIICANYHLYELWTKINSDPPDKAFRSDGCSGGWPDTWHDFNLYPACFLHDLKYWCGYPGETIERLIADLELEIDVLKITQDVSLSQIMYSGVRVGGGSIWGRTYSYGFGRTKRSNK